MTSDVTFKIKTVKGKEPIIKNYGAEITFKGNEGILGILLNGIGGILEKHDLTICNFTNKNKKELEANYDKLL